MNGLHFLKKCCVPNEHQVEAINLAIVNFITILPVARKMSPYRFYELLVFARKKSHGKPLTHSAFIFYCIFSYYLK